MASKHDKNKKAKRWLLGTLVCCLVIAIAAVALAMSGVLGPVGLQTDGGVATTTTTGTTGTTKPPKPVKVSSATVLSTGDIMVHEPQLTGAKVPGKEEWDFGAFFKEVDTYFKDVDFSVANLETTFAGNDGRIFSGYPIFNTPDSLIDAIKESGLSMVLTANNHCYDTGTTGLKRTQQVLVEKGVLYNGTRLTTYAPVYTVREINGIRIGMVSYTYETGRVNGLKSINGLVVKEENTELINSFTYGKLDEFYAEVDTVIEGMKKEGAQAVVFYMHWGDEYQTTENSWQNRIAQTLCDKGVDIIIGGHPHVIQPMELLKSEDGKHQTICLYSAGNAVSNQRQERMVSCPSGHTEDGLLFYYTLDKYSDGKVVISDVDIIPTWVDKYPGGGGYQYTIYPLEKATDGAKKYELSSSSAARAQRSYERTKAIVAEGLTECQKAIGCDITFAEN